MQILSVNKKEMIQSAELLGLTQQRGKHTLTHHDKSFSIWDYCTMMKVLKVQYVLITDGSRGAYVYDGNDIYFGHALNIHAISSLGAGDAFASTFCYALIMNFSVYDCLSFALIQTAYVVKNLSTTEGLKDFSHLDKIRHTNLIHIEKL